MAIRNYFTANPGRAGYALFLSFFGEISYDVKLAFAAAHEDDILKLWQGLGYYSRGRNMLKTARLVTEHYNGVFQCGNMTSLIKLKGIGEYTAPAYRHFRQMRRKRWLMAMFTGCWRGILVLMSLLIVPKA
jgi:hypothetical protein